MTDKKSPEYLQWKDTNDPPKTVKGCWSESVAVVTNMGNILESSYFGNSGGGCWQRTKHFQKDEVVNIWISKPKE